MVSQSGTPQHELTHVLTAAESRSGVSQFLFHETELTVYQYSSTFSLSTEVMACIMIHSNIIGINMKITILKNEYELKKESGNKR